MPFETWDPLQTAVQPDLVNGRYTNGGLTLLASGPPQLTTLTALSAALAAGESGESDIVWPMGLVQNVNIGQNRGFMRIWEVGSERSFWIANRSTGNMNLSRVWMDGPSLMRALYAYYQDLIPPTTVPWVYPNQGALPGNMANPHDVVIPPGYENMYLNLASDLFTQPFGMMMVMRNSNLSLVGTVYLENCVIPQHSWATDAQGTIVQESAGIQFERIVPINVTSVPLLTGLSGAAASIGAEAA